MAQRSEPSSLKELKAAHDKVLADAEGLALALERIRRASAALLELGRAHGAFDSPEPSVARAFKDLEYAHGKAEVGDGYFQAWAVDVLEGNVVRRRGGPQAKLETFHEVRTRASMFNLHVHFQHTFEGTQYAIYRGRDKVGHANNDRDCMTSLRKLMRAAQ